MARFFTSIKNLRKLQNDKKWREFANADRARRRIQKTTHSQKNLELGLEREKKVLETLKLMRKNGEIRCFIKTERLGYADLHGIDFYIVKINKKAYQVIKLSVTGSSWVEHHKKKHPDIPVISVGDADTLETLRKKILKIL